ncbi:MAG: hypothetical protein Q8P24_14435 [Desulfobacterales bacterium]|nr:hypothetical protein [Desulfobacterales bacterium]
MKTLIGGILAAVLGVIGLAIWFDEFLELLAGAIPVMLLCGGALAIYLGYDELKEDVPAEKAEDVEKCKEDIDELKKEISSLKEEKKGKEGKEEKKGKVEKK